MQPPPIRVLPRIVVNGSITVSGPISTPTSMTVAAGSTIVTPARMWRSWIARCASLLHPGEAGAVVDAEHEPGSSTTWAATVAPSARSRSSTCGR